MVVGIVGPYCDNNYGDYAMLINNIRDIFDYCNNVSKVIVFAYDNVFLEKILFTYFDTNQVKIILVESTKEMLVKTSNKYEIVYEDCICSVDQLVKNITNTERLQDVIKTIDVMIVSGGGCFNYYWLAAHRKWKMAAIITPILIAANLKKRINFLANTFGPWGNQKEFFESFFSMISPCDISVRDDNYSSSMLTSIGVDESERNIDDLLYINKKICNIKPKEKKDYFVIELYCSIEELNLIIDIIDSFISDMKSEMNLNAIFLPFAKDYGGEIQGDYLKKHLKNEIYVVESECYYEIDKIEEIIANAEFVLCDRYHALVRSVVNKVPCIQYIRKIDNGREYYFEKYKGIMESLFDDGCNSLFNTTSYNCLFDFDEIKQTISMQKRYFDKSILGIDLDNFKQKRIDYIKRCCSDIY